MRCSRARKKMAPLTRPLDLASSPELDAHVGSCPGCAATWRAHLRLIAELESPRDLPEFQDLAPRILARLEARRGPAAPAWRWAMAATLALAALALGYLFGSQSADAGAADNGFDSAYQETLTVVPPGATDVTYLESPRRAPRADSESRP